MVGGPNDKWILRGMFFLICLVRLASSAFVACRFDSYRVSSPLCKFFGRDTRPGPSWSRSDLVLWRGMRGINLSASGRFGSGIIVNLMSIFSEKSKKRGAALFGPYLDSIWSALGGSGGFLARYIISALLMHDRRPSRQEVSFGTL